MKLNYYVLGKKDNQMISFYFEMYYDKLLSMLQELANYHILTEEIKSLFKVKNKDFILNAEQSSIINLLHKEIIKKELRYLGDIKIFEEKLKKEINIFLKEGIGSSNLSMNKGKNITGTNIKLTDIDNNPYNTMEAHPEHIPQNAISGNWGEKTQEEWLEVYEKTFNLLKKIDPGFYEELNQTITKIIPLGTARGIHNSASYKECVGHLYMGYTIDSNKPEINNLEAIIHELSHNKLNLIMQFDPIVLNDKQEKYYSAIRPDARHIHGIFLGYHAFAPTMYVVMKAYLDGYLGSDKNWYDKIILYYIKTKLLQKMIKKYAILTELGKEILEEIDFVMSKIDDLLKQMNPSKQDLQKAKEKQNKHFMEVNNAYPYLEY